MKKAIALVCMGICFSASVFAGAQQEKMKGCNDEAKGMKGDERKAFMSKCLKKDYVLKGESAVKEEAKPVAKSEPAGKAAAPAAEAKAAPVGQQDKMKNCNADAKSKELKGDARKEFMKTCLKG